MYDTTAALLIATSVYVEAEDCEQIVCRIKGVGYLRA